MTTIEDRLSEKTTVLEEIELDLFTGFEDTTALEDKKSLTVFSAIAVVVHAFQIHSTLSFATMGLAANLGIATTNSLTDLP